MAVTQEERTARLAEKRQELGDAAHSPVRYPANARRFDALA